MPRTSRRKNQPVKGGLKGFTDARKSSIDLLRDIQTHVVAKEARSGNDHRSKDKIHVSELTKSESCPRRLYYKISGTPESDTEATAGHRLVMIWSAGTAEHEKWQRWLQEMGDLWGTWTCRVCEYSFEATSPVACESCGIGGLLRYDEVNLEDTVYPLIGHADGAVPRLNALVEIKSFAAGSVRIENPSLVNEHTHKVNGKSLTDIEGLWKALKRPLRSHLIQGMIYLWLCKRTGLPYDRIIFIYENKTNQATKTFEVKLAERHLRTVFEWLDEIMAGLESNTPPPRPSTFALDAKPCRDCPFRTTCWTEESSDDDRTPSTAVPSRRPRAGGEARGREAEVQPASSPRPRDPSRPRRHHRAGGSGPDSADDRVDPVGRAPRGAVGDGRGGREVGRGRNGEGQGPRFARRSR